MFTKPFEIPCWPLYTLDIDGNYNGRPSKDRFGRIKCFFSIQGIPYKINLIIMLIDKKFIN